MKADIALVSLKDGNNLISHILILRLLFEDRPLQFSKISQSKYTAIVSDIGFNIDFKILDDRTCLEIKETRRLLI